MSDLEVFVDRLRTKMADLGPNETIDNGRLRDPLEFLFSHFDLDKACRELTRILGEDRIKDAFAGHHPAELSVVTMFLARNVPGNCIVNSDGTLSFMADDLLRRIQALEKVIATGIVEYKISMRVMNIDISREFDLGGEVHFHKLPPGIVEDKYRSLDRFMPMLPVAHDYLCQHRVEAVVFKRGTPRNLREESAIEAIGAIINSILHAFTYCHLPVKSETHVTHLCISSAIESSTHYMGIGSISYDPIMLVDDDVSRLDDAYRFLKEAQNDRVLETAVDRFLLGRKRGEHHPNRINEPNWDKVVDYVIALETLLLTSHSNQNQELSYRFALNGANLLRQTSSHDVASLFHSLKNLYAIRSSVVHGDNEKKILKAANKFIATLGIDSSERQHALGRLMLICKEVETWIEDLFKQVAQLPIADRPYRRQDGWEQLIWNPPRTD